MPETPEAGLMHGVWAEVVEWHLNRLISAPSGSTSERDSESATHARATLLSKETLCRHRTAMRAFSGTHTCTTVFVPTYVSIFFQSLLYNCNALINLSCSSFVQLSRALVSVYGFLLFLAEGSCSIIISEDHSHHNTSSQFAVHRSRCTCGEHWLSGARAIVDRATVYIIVIRDDDRLRVRRAADVRSAPSQLRNDHPPS